MIIEKIPSWRIITKNFYGEDNCNNLCCVELEEGEDEEEDDGSHDDDTKNKRKSVENKFDGETMNEQRAENTNNKNNNNINNMSCDVERDKDDADVREVRWGDGCYDMPHNIKNNNNNDKNNNRETNTENSIKIDTTTTKTATNSTEGSKLIKMFIMEQQHGLIKGLFAQNLSESIESVDLKVYIDDPGIKVWGGERRVSVVVLVVGIVRFLVMVVMWG